MVFFYISAIERSAELKDAVLQMTPPLCTLSQAQTTSGDASNLKR